MDFGKLSVPYVSDHRLFGDEIIYLTPIKILISVDLPVFGERQILRSLSRGLLGPLSESQTNETNSSYDNG